MSFPVATIPSLPGNRPIRYLPCSCGCRFANGATCAHCGQPLKATT